MLKNYIRIAWRNFTRNRFYSLINVLGLAVGLSCLILIVLFVHDELSFDEFHEKKERIHFVATESRFGKNSNRGLSTPYPLGRAMKQEVPEVKEYVVTMWPGSGEISRDGENFRTEDRVMMATESFLEVFGFPLKAGNPQTALESPASVVITERMAQKYFPEDDPLGKTITVDRYDKREYTVTGIAENMKYNSYLNFDFLTTIRENSSVETNRDSWRSRMFHTYVLLREGASWDRVEPKLSGLVKTNLGEETGVSFFSIPLTGLYLSELASAGGFKGSVKYLYIFSAVALFILILACINYMNLATARATRRSLEVGVRKVVGADRRQLVFQFITEAVVVTLFAFIIGLILAEALLPFFNEFVEKEISLNFIGDSLILFALLGVALLVGVFSGSYPAFFLSRFKPVAVLKGKAYKSLVGAGLRKGLVIIQFAVSAALIISTLIAFNQLNFVMQKDLGFRGEQVIYIPAHQIQDRVETFRQIARQHSAVLEASAASGMPGRFSLRISQPFDPQDPDNIFGVHLLRSDAHYADVLGLELAAGRYFDEERISDRDHARVINEAMLAELGWKAEQAIGRELSDGAEVIGVVKDFHFQSLHHSISPVFIKMKPTEASRYDNYNLLALRFNPGQVNDLLDYLEKEWSKLVPSDPMTYHFLDEQFAQLYETDRKLSRAFLVFAGIAIFIACMGLFGLAAFSAQRRTKEIGIRKVLGATISSIVGLLTKDFLKLVLLGFVIAVPVAWYAMNRWLADFAYRIEIGAGVFLLAGGAALLIALATVSLQSVRAALANPVESLRSD